MSRVNLQEVDRVDITVLVDNYSALPLLQGAKTVKRARRDEKSRSPMHRPDPMPGWKVINKFAKEMPDRFLLNSVGTTHVFKSA